MQHMTRYLDGLRFGLRCNAQHTLDADIKPMSGRFDLVQPDFTSDNLTLPPAI